MIAEEIIKKINDEKKEIQKRLSNIDYYLSELGNLRKKDWDWISVRRASQTFDISLGMIYEKVNSGKLKSKRFGSKIYVSAKEVSEVNDIAI